MTNVKSIGSIITKSAVICLIAVGALSAQNSVALRPSSPTHYLYTPMPHVNPPYHMVAGLRELSFALPGNLQLQLSLVDNIGKTCLAAKYGFADNMSLGAGLANTFINLGDHGIHGGAESRLGIFFTYGLLNTGDFSMAITPHTQIGEHFSIGGDFALSKKVVDVWSVLWEAGLSGDLTAEALYLYTTAAIRVHPPAVPFLFVDIGAGTNEFNVKWRPGARVFVDVMMCFVTN